MFSRTLSEGKLMKRKTVVIYKCKNVLVTHKLLMNNEKHFEYQLGSTEEEAKRNLNTEIKFSILLTNNDEILVQICKVFTPQVMKNNILDPV